MEIVSKLRGNTSMQVPLYLDKKFLVFIQASIPYERVAHNLKLFF